MYQTLRSHSRKIASITWVMAILFFSMLMLLITLPYLSLKTDVDFLLTKQGVVHILHWRYSFYLHISLSILVLLAGAIQFSRHIRQYQAKLHRVSGYIYLLVIIFISGPSGFIMGLYANGGWPARISFSLLAILWIIFTAIAWKKILIKDFTAHRKWMIRSYSLTLSAVTLRLMLYFIPMITLLPPKPLYVFVAWSSWIFNLLVAECIIWFTSKRSIPVVAR